MAWLPRMRRSLGVRHAIVVALVTGWVIIMAAGAGPEPASSEWVGLPSMLNVLLVLFGLSAIFTVTVIIYLVLTGEAGPLEVPERKPIWPAVILLVLLVFLIANFARFDNEDSVETAVPDVQEQVEPEPSDGLDASLTSGELLALLAVAASAIGLVLWSRRRSSSLMAHTEPAEVAGLDGLDRIVTRAASRLRLGHDPRSAVLNAYVELEHGLAAEGIARGSSETPAEHVHRALKSVTVDHEAVDSLSALYEQARFSTTPITASDQQAAIEALDLIRRGLGVGS